MESTMSRSTISTFDLFKLFPDSTAARTYLEGRRWSKGVVCPYCGESEQRITTRKNGYYRCNNCTQDFTVRTGTIFERSHVGLHKWIYAMYLLMTSRKGISSLQLAKEIGVTQKTAWFMLQRIREACGGDTTQLQGIVQVDETFVGGKEMNKHQSKKLKAGRGTIGKKPVVGMRDEKGRVKTQVVDKVDAKTITKVVEENVKKGSTLHTDESSAYDKLTDHDTYKRESVNHGSGEFSKQGVSTNSVESVWAVMKRGMYGVYHQISRKHLERYVNEFTFRLNDGNVKNHTMDRLTSLLAACFRQPRLKYAELIANG